MILRNLTKLASALMQNPGYYLRDMGMVGADNNTLSFYSEYSYQTPENGGISLRKTTTGGTILTQTFTWYIFLGSGTTQPTIDDYCLEAEVTNKSSVKFSRTNSTFVRTSSKLIFSSVINNTGEEAITFTEVMLGYDTSHTGNGSDTTIALTRDVISPVTIPAGGSKTITIVIDFAAMATSVA